MDTVVRDKSITLIDFNYTIDKQAEANALTFAILLLPDNIVVKFRVDPIRLPILLPYPPTKHMQKTQCRNAEENGDDGVPGHGPREADGVEPGEDEEWVDEGGEVEHDGVEDDDGHALEGVGVNDVGADGCVAHLDAGTDCHDVSTDVTV